MSTRANPIVIGAFVVGASVLLLVALLVWGGTGLFRTRLDYVLFFDSAVTGLNKGAPVVARGVKVGEVTEVQLRWGSSIVAVYVALQPDALKGTAKGGPARVVEEAVRERGLRAQLRVQSFVTGVLYVALDTRPDTPIVLRGLDPHVPELPTIPTDIEVWTAKLEQFANKIGNIPLDEIGESAAAILADVKQIVAAKGAHDLLPNASSAVADARALLQRVDGQVDPVFAELKTTLARADATLDAARMLVLDLDKRIDPLATSADAALKAAQATIEDMRGFVARLDTNVDPLLTSLRKTSDSAGAAMERAQVTLAGIDRTLDQESPLGYELFLMLKEFRAAAQSLRSLADYLERVPDAPLYGVRRPSGGAK